MKSLGLAIAGLLGGALISSAVGSGCCASTSTMPPGVYHANGAEPDYTFALGGNGTAVETYTRNGKRYVVTYRVTAAQ